MSPKRSKSLIYELTFSIIAQTTDKFQEIIFLLMFPYGSHYRSTKHSPSDYLSILLLESDSSPVWPK